MRRLVLLFLAFFFLMISMIKAQGNHYSIKVKINEDMSKAEGIQTVIYENPNDYALNMLYFRIHDTGYKPQCIIQKILNNEGNDINPLPHTQQ